MKRCINPLGWTVMPCRLTGHLNDSGRQRQLCQIPRCRGDALPRSRRRQRRISAAEQRQRDRQVEVEEAAGEPEAPTNMCFTRIVYLLVRLAGPRLQPAPVRACVGAWVRVRHFQSFEVSVMCVSVTKLVLQVVEVMGMILMEGLLFFFFGFFLESPGGRHWLASALDRRPEAQPLGEGGAAEGRGGGGGVGGRGGGVEELGLTFTAEETETLLDGRS